MSERIDPLAGEVSLQAELTDKGVAASARSRAVTALDRLVGNLVDVPGAYIERWVQKIRRKSDFTQTLQEAEFQAGLDKLESDPQFGDRALNQFLMSQARKQNNREEVARIAISNLVEEQEAVVDETAEELDEDWLNTFEKHAENASGERLREMWGKVLAGEIRQPGTYSLSTLRFISELDLEIARLFQSISKYRLPRGFLPKPEHLRGEVLLEYNFLEEVGLLQGVNIGLQEEIKSNDDWCYYFLDQFAVRFRSQKSINMGIIPLTRVGREIATILPKEPEYNIAKFVAVNYKHISSEIEIVQKMGNLPDGQYKIRVIEKMQGKK